MSLNGIGNGYGVVSVMNMSRLAKTALGVSAAAAMLAGCSAGASQSGLPTASGSTNSMSVSSHMVPAALLNTSVLAVKPAAVRLVRRGGFFSPDPAGPKAFISDAGNNTVDRYTFPGAVVRAPITANLNQPQGLCAQNGTSAWVANTSDSNLLHYGPGGHLLAGGTLSDPGQYPVGCSVYGTTLAVSNIISTTGGNGSVTIFPNGTGPGTNYAVSNLARVYFIGYDPNGNLFVDGSDSNGVFGLAELVNGGAAFTPLTLAGATVNFPGTVQFAGGHLVIGDQSGSGGHSILYQTIVSGATATVTGSTQLNSAVDAVQCWIRGGRVIVPDAGSANVQFYSYPAGGTPTTTINGFGQPIGSTVVQ
jgi:hypothetical protein